MKRREEETLESEIKDGVYEIYRNYGIDTFDIEDEDLKRVITHYRKNPDSLSKDIKSSREHSHNVLDNNII